MNMLAETANHRLISIKITFDFARQICATVPMRPLGLDTAWDAKLAYILMFLTNCVCYLPVSHSSKK
jgi:hypothetical protein